MDQIITEIAEVAKQNLIKHGSLAPVVLPHKNGVIVPQLVMNLRFENDEQKYKAFVMIGITAQKFFKNGFIDRIVLVIEGAMKAYDEHTSELVKRNPELYAPLTYPESQRQEIIIINDFDLIKKTDCFYSIEFKKNGTSFTFKQLEKYGSMPGGMRDKFYLGLNYEKNL